MQLDQFKQAALDEILKKIILIAHPKKVILFGSAVRGEMGTQSDFDLLVVVENSVLCRRTAQEIYRSLVGVGFAADILVVHEEDIELLKDQDGTVIKPALLEGKVLHAA